MAQREGVRYMDISPAFKAPSLLEEAGLETMNLTRTVGM